LTEVDSGAAEDASPAKENEMATMDVVNLAGEKVGSLELAEEVFGAVNEDLLLEAVQNYLP